ncbi:MAG: hypothetical protein Q8829_02885, partial [Candidatus Phytoplasma australasiaticum]|nr:hypothetical protein [Candidatus Phytoplasma australasiaticum]
SCNLQYKNNKVSDFTTLEKDYFVNCNEQLSSEGYRILAIAYRSQITEHTKSKKPPKSLGKI